MGSEKAGISRRGFVAGAGAAAIGAGFAGSVIGCSKPEEAPAEKEGTFSSISQEEGQWIPTTCNMCFNQCSILAHVVDGKVIELTGNPDSPVGRGHICGKGAAGIMQLYDPNRITKPMKRTNPNKGFDEDPGWVEISWDEALDTIDEVMKTTIAEKGPHAVTGMSMVASQAGSLVRHLALGVIYGNAEGSCSDICGAGVHQVSYLFTGAGNAMPDYKYCNYLVQFGTQAGTATRHGFNMTAEPFAERRADGLKLVVFDPHMSAGAEKADLWAPILPGTDAAVALSLAQVLVNELNIYDEEFLIKRTNGPALIDTSTQRIIRQADTNKALFMDLSDNKAKPYDECEKPALEGTFDVDGVSVTTGFSLYREHIKKYTPEYAEEISTVPASTIRKVAQELGEAACIGQTIEIDGVTLPYRPACVDAFSGITRHKHSMLTCWAVFSLNNILGSTNSVGGWIGFDPACNGWADNNPQMAFRPSIWEPDGFIEDVSLLLAFPHSYYDLVYNRDYTPTTMGLMEIQPLSEDNHFEHICQAHPDLYHTQAAEVAFCYACNPIKWWGNYDEQAEIFKSYKYVIGVDIFLNESSYFYDLILPEANYLERCEPLPHFALNHRVIGGMDNPWAVTAWQKVVEPKDDAPSSFELFAELAHRAGKDAEFIGTLNMMYRVKEEYSVPLDQKLDPEAFADSVFKSIIDEEHDYAWMKEHGVYTYPRKVDEVYIWANDAPGRVPLYWDFMLEAKGKVEAKAAELNIPWETDDYQPLPDWKPGCGFEVTDPDFDIIPTYYTNAINTDSWLMENPWINEVNEADPYGYTIEINAATAAAKGLASGDSVRLVNQDGVFVEGRIATSEGVHPSCVSVIGGHWGSKSEYMPIAKDKGVPIVHLIPGQTPDRMDHVCSAFDQTIRVKIEKM